MSTGERPPSLWRVMFLAEHYGRMVLALDEVAEQIGLNAGTIRNRRTRGEFTWLRSDARTLTADVADVAAYLDRRRSGVDEPADRPLLTGVYVSRTQRAGPGRRKHG